MAHGHPNPSLAGGGPGLSFCRTHRRDVGSGEQNLVLNARDAALRADPPRRISLGSRGDGEHLEIYVRDSGSGVPADILDKIFDPFFTTKEVGKGTGLGLAVVYNILQDHGAAVEVESTLGKGTKFRLFFPLPDGAGDAGGMRRCRVRRLAIVVSDAAGCLTEQEEG